MINFRRNDMTKIFKKFKLSLLAAALGFTALGSAASAKSLKARVISPFGTYIALGDSRATGLGFAGYDTENEVDGFLEKTEGSYTYQLASEWAPTRKVRPAEHEWTSFASNKFRMEDIYFELASAAYENNILENEVEYDEYYKAVFDAENSEGLQKNHDYLEAVYDYLEVYPNEMDENGKLSSMMNEAIQEADYVTLDAGINGFTDFLVSKIGEIVKSDYVDEVGDVLGDLGFGINYGGKDTAQGLLDRMFGEGNVPLQTIYNYVFGAIYLASNKTLDFDSLDYIKDIPGVDSIHLSYLLEMLVYTFVSYCYYLNETTKLIMKINPDVKLTVVGLSNPIEGMKVDIGPWTFPFGDIIGSLVEVANIYARVGTWEAGHYFFVDPLAFPMTRRIENITAADSVNDLTSDEKINLKNGLVQLVNYLNTVIDNLNYGTNYTVEEYFAPISGADKAALIVQKKLLAALFRGGSHNVFDIDDIENASDCDTAFDLFFAIDCGKERLGDAEKLFDKAAKTINIDYEH